MSIVTKGGDQGTTALMYGRRVPKSHPRIQATGAVDELNAALGVARASGRNSPQSELLVAIQNDLVLLMGELATELSDLPRYVQDGYSFLKPTMTAKLDATIKELESRNLHYQGWATPGANPQSAGLDLARTVCRRAERCVCVLQEAQQLQNPEILVYLNRLSDLLWLMARAADMDAPKRRKLPKTRSTRRRRPR
jgi:cob(I)alamin adenosyltransferase